MICRLVVSMRKYYYRCLLESQAYWVQELSIPVEFRASKLRSETPSLLCCHPAKQYPADWKGSSNQA